MQCLARNVTRQIAAKKQDRIGNFLLFRLITHLVIGCCLLHQLDFLGKKLAEPVMLLVMGVLVGVLVSSLILPIFQLSRATG